RQVAQDTPYHTEYIMQTHVRSVFVPAEAVGEIVAIESARWGEQVGTHHPAENLTWGQFCDALLVGHQLEPDGEDPCIPVVAYKENHVGFLGFRTVASVSSRLIREFGLTINGFDV